MNLFKSFGFFLPLLVLAFPVHSASLSATPTTPSATPTANMTSNLPPPTYSASVTCYVSTEIEAPLETVWDVLSDFPKYPEWNPFVRSQQITDKSGKTVLEDQTPGVGKYLLMQTHIPPTSTSNQTSFEIIIAYDVETRRMAWKSLLPEWFLHAERWQALSTTANGTTLYESRELFAGPGAYLVKWFLLTNLMKSFEAMADALKTRSEGQ